MPVSGAVKRAVLALALCTAAGALVYFVSVDHALAQGSLFGAPRGAQPVPSTGFTGWLFAKQAGFYRQFAGLVRAAKTDGSAAWTLFGLSFLYGIFHAAGPGHGKAVISSYLVANEETWRRGVWLSFASAMLQALAAVLIVGIAAALLNATAPTMKTAVNVIETVSYGLIILIGLRLLWVKGRALVREWRAIGQPADAHAHSHERAHAHDHHHGHHHHAHDHGHAHDHSHAHDHHDDASAWGHAHAPEPQQLAGPGGWKRGLSAVLAVGLRPCSGAILVLVFALAQGLFWAGVVSTFVMGLGTAITVAVIATVAVGARAWANRLARTQTGYGLLAMRAIEVCAAVVIVAFGSLLLAGYLASEQLIGF